MIELYLMLQLILIHIASARVDVSNVALNGMASLGWSANSCYDGSYMVQTMPFGACSGFRPCDAGHYCQEGLKFPCPAGSYGASTGLNNSTCSGKCSPGFYCPSGSVSSTTFFCGHPSVYCPEGSGDPLPAPSGYFTVDINGVDSPGSVSSRSAVVICPRGYYCLDGIKLACLPGTFGDSFGLSNMNCSGKCPEGWYCPVPSTQPFAFSCGKSTTTYCPEGSERAMHTRVGYYAVASHIDEGGGYGAEVVCPRGSYCIGGARFLCPGGRYGSQVRESNSSCAGLCTAGFYCPAGSITNKQAQCPSAAFYCPEGSESPMPVTAGYYTIDHEMLDFTIPIDLGGNAGYAQLSSNPFEGLARMAQTICEPGHFCLADGIKRMCPAGRYGSTPGLSTPSCSGYCSAGFFCSEGSNSNQQKECGSPDRFCPPGSPHPQMALIGYYTVSGGGRTTRAAERKCEPGFYCQQGEKFPCSPGTWGGEYGLSTSSCSGTCASGYYCPLGSISHREKLCGDPGRYCPGGSAAPLPVTTGFYSVGGNDSTRSSQRIAPPGHFASDGLLYSCPAGYFGSVPGLSTSSCSGACAIGGYYCPTGSISPVMRYCGGDDAFCPPNTVAPIPVHSGFYTADYLYELCPPGKWRPDAPPPPPNVLAATVTVDQLSECEPCPEGTYKHVAGDSFSQCQPCGEPHAVSTPDRMTCTCLIVVTEGRISYFNVTTGACETLSQSEIYKIDADAWSTGTALTRSKQHPCSPGHYCVKGLQYPCPPGRYGSLTQETRPTCEGACMQGYFCMQSSTSPMSYPCGGAAYICPEGSYAPLPVPLGFYSNEQVPDDLRYSQSECPMGYYCPGDGRRYACPPGTFADREGTTSIECMGPCERGHYCLAASPSSTQFKCGNATVYCPRGSAGPTAINDGFYGAFTGPDGGAQQLWDRTNETFSVELPCEPGYYCKGGVKQPCPPGTFGWRYGMVQASCGGLCAAGYYCPSFLEPQPDAAPYTVWPRVPHTTAAELECGSVTYFCPKGSFYPHIVGGGNYSYGGGNNNRTRIGQTQCSPGSYCEGAISILCPRGRYGDSYGLSDSTCTDACPPGYYCPSGTVAPKPCPSLEYSTGEAAECSKCPGNRITPLQCQNEKGCCYRGDFGY